MKTTRVALYARVSTRDKGQTVENQLRQLREFCSTQQDWQVVREYTDQRTGKNADREQFQNMFAAASRREFDVVLFWALDRFSREGVYQTLQHLQRLTSYGVGYRSYSEQFLDSCGIFRDAVIGILATVAKQERIRLSERVLAGLERARAQGRVVGRPHVECDEQKARELRTSGMSLRTIAKTLGLSKSTICRITSATAS
jgi:DNA invertase Pin-like site-specific DNA recombinase